MLFFYNHLKGKEVTKLLQVRYFTELLQFTTNIFRYNIPDSIRPEYLERFLNCEGLIGIQKQPDGRYFLTIGSTIGRLDQYGIGTEFEGNTFGDSGEYGNYIRGTIGKDVAICWHNSAHTPNLDIIRTAETLTEYDKSIMKAVEVCRAQPVFVARDGNVQKAVEEAAGRILAGDYVAVLSKNVMAEYSGQKALELLELTQPKVAEYIQYLNEGADKCYQRYYQKYGQAQQTTSKHTTTLLDELHGSDAVSFIAIEDMLQCRKEFCAMAAAIWGDTFEVELSPIWQKEYDRYKAETAKPAAELKQIEAQAEQAAASSEPDQDAGTSSAEGQSEEENRDGENNT